LIITFNGGRRAGETIPGIANAGTTYSGLVAIARTLVAMFNTSRQ
jgi:hypothetical protein